MKTINDKKFIYIIMTFLFITMIGCSNKSDFLNDTANNNKSNTEDSTISESNKDVTDDKVSSKNENEKIDSEKNLKKENSQKELINNITKLAKEGKIINSDFSVKLTNIQDIEEKLGKADTSNFVPEAKGAYYTFSKDNVAFGCNKGEQVFEARSFDSKLGELSLSAVKKVLGDPAYSSKYDNEQIIGYTAGSEFKILFVFKESKDGENDLLLDHYSVLYPKGTVNNMADDPGREW